MRLPSENSATRRNCPREARANRKAEEYAVVSRTQRKHSPKREKAIEVNSFVPQPLGHRGSVAFVRGSGVPDRKRSEESPAKATSFIPVYNAAIQDSRMTFAFFVESKFIPEHVEHKTAAGKTHYQAILKHLLKPESVNCMFGSLSPAKPRLKAVPDWPYLDDVQLCDLKSDHVRQLVLSASDRGYSSQTVKHIRNVLSAIISHAQREGCFSGANPVTLVKLPPIFRETEHNLTIFQTKATLELMQYPEKEIALITLTTGMNLGEICDLQWKHVNLTESVRFVDGEPVPARSIAVRTHWNRDRLGDVKHGRPRNVEIPEPLFSTINDLTRRDMNTNENDFVLTSQSGEPILAASIRMGRLKPIGRKLGLPWLSWQVLRRAHTGLLSEFRTQLNTNLALMGPRRSR
jgi:integrase